MEWRTQSALSAPLATALPVATNADLPSKRSVEMFMRVAILLGKDLTPAWMRLLPVALLLSACGGGGGDNQGGSSQTPILRVGMQRQYVGTATRTIVYANPTANAPNNTLVYSFTENQNVLQVENSAAANFDVHTDYTYSVVQDPGVGTVPISQSVDNYENLLVSGDSQMTATVAQNTVVASNDETSNALGGGPYTETTTTSSTYPSARNSFSYPLQTGATMNVPQSSVQDIAFSDVDASGTAPPNGSNLSYTKTRTENEDGSFSYQTAYVNSDSVDLTQSSDGSGSDTSTSATAATTTTLGLPATANGVSTLPIARSSVSAATGATTNTSYTAADWYPTSGAPNSPLVLQAETVLGPVSSLPAQCSGALPRPNIYEIDTTTTSQVTISPSYSVTKTRSFNADGVTVCSLSQETSYDYDLLTGALTSTTTTETNTLLNEINY
jgi:hypothetical protein